MWKPILAVIGVGIIVSALIEDSNVAAAVWIAIVLIGIWMGTTDRKKSEN